MLWETPENAYCLEKEGAQRASTKASGGHSHLGSATQILQCFPHKASPEWSKLGQFLVRNRTLLSLLTNPGKSQLGEQEHPLESGRQFSAQIPS